MWIGNLASYSLLVCVVLGHAWFWPLLYWFYKLLDPFMERLAEMTIEVLT